VAINHYNLAQEAFDKVLEDMESAQNSFVDYGKDQVGWLKAVYKNNGDVSAAMCQLQTTMSQTFENNMRSIIVAELNVGSIIVARPSSIIVA
jgi:hypothetical protein